MGTRRLPPPLPPPPPPPLRASAVCAAPSAPPLSPPPPNAPHVDVYALPLATPVAEALPASNQQIHRTGDRLNVIVRTEDSFCPSAWATLWFTTRLVAYHAGYCALSVAGAAVVAAGLALSLALLPLCGFGIVVFQSLLRSMYFLGRADAKLHNLIADDTENEIEFPDTASSRAERRPLLPLHDPRGLSAEDSGRPRFNEAALSGFTPRAVLVVVYFGSLRLLLALWSVLSLLMLLLFSLLFIDDKGGSNSLIRTDIQVDNEPLFYAVCLAVIVLSCVSLHVFGRVSQAATRFFCCE